MSVGRRFVVGVLSSLVTLITGGCASVFCPGDTPMAAVSSTVGGFPTATACEASRAQATCPPRIAAPTPACRTHCASGFLGGFCLPKVANATFDVGPACYPVDTQPRSYEYLCVNTATCTCF